MPSGGVPSATPCGVRIATLVQLCGNPFWIMVKMYRLGTGKKGKLVVRK